MSRIGDQMRRLQPEGVRFAPLGELLKHEQPGKYLVESTSYNDAFPTPVLTAGQTFILGRTDEVDGVYPASTTNPVVIFDDFTTAFKWVDFPFKAKSSAMKMLTVKPDVEADLRYIFLAMQTIDYKPQEHSRQWIGTYSGFRIPLPPMSVQHEIIRNLNRFAELDAELEVALGAELEARRRQHAFTCRQLVLAVPAEWVSIGDLGGWTGGMTPSKSESRYWASGSIPWMASMDVGDAANGSIRGRVTAAAVAETPLRLIDPPSVAVVMRSNILRRVLPIRLVEVATTVNQDIRLLTPREAVDARYVFHALRALSEDLRESCVRTDGSMAAVESQAFFAQTIPLPSLGEQVRIANTMTLLDTLANDLTIGLSAEIAARRKQYEYYRDRLLTFEEAPA